MTKSNFTAQEIATVIYSVSKNFNISTTKAGNLKLEPLHAIKTDTHSGKGTKYFTIYKPADKNGKIIIRSLTKTKYGAVNIYPLNMKRGREYSKTWNEYYLTYNLNDSFFPDMESAMEYFENYLEKYHADILAA